MKKNILLTTFSIILFTIIVFPRNVFAEVEVTNLQEAVSEEIETFGAEDSYKELVDQLKSYDLSNYKDSNQKVNVYMFRGSTCSHCFEAIEYFASIYGELGKYFNVKTYETWQNQDNAKLMEKVAKEMGEEASGVPYIIIGDKSWSGYAESMNNEIESKIKSEYKKEKNKRTDVIKNANNGTSKNSNNNASDIVSVIVILIVVAGIVFGVVMARKKANK